MSTKDYYDILGVSKTATEDEIRRAYKQHALKWHPDKNPDNKEEAEKKFKEIGEAYGVLSDKEQRANYDRFGIDGVKRKGGSGSGAGGEFSAKDAQELFANIFGTGGLFGNLFGARGPGRGPNAFVFTTGPQGAAPQGGIAGMSFPFPPATGFPFPPGTGFPFPFAHPSPPQVPPFMQPPQSPQTDTIKYIDVSLKQLFTGTTLRLGMTHDIVEEDGKKSSTTTRPFEIHIAPGWKAGTKLTYEKMGDTLPGQSEPSNLIIIIRQKDEPDCKFERRGNDLRYLMTISVWDALLGTKVEITTLDDKPLIVEIPSVRPGIAHVVPGQGMPVSKTPGKRGDLFIDFNIDWPSELTDEMKSKLKQAIGRS